MHHHTGLVAMFLRDDVLVERSRNALEQLAVKHRMNILRCYARTFGAWIAKSRGRYEQAVVAYQDGLTAIEATGTRIWMPFHLCGLAESLGACDRHDEALHTLEQALRQAEQTGERWCVPELWRVRGELMLARPHADHDEAMRSFVRGLSCAREQLSRLWELRVTMSLARLRLRQGSPRDAAQLLAPICAWFAQGSDTADVIEAQTLLDDLQRSPLGPCT
jgi:predicted ATPase